MDDATKLLLIGIVTGKIDFAEEILDTWADLPPRFRDYLEAGVVRLQSQKWRLQNIKNSDGVIKWMN